MAGVNPFPDDPDRGAAWEQGYEAGFAEPETDHQPPPLSEELVDIFFQGEQSGRDDRRNEPNTQDPLPATQTDDFSRFESAPDGTLIPIPQEAPEGNPIRDDAQITVNPRTAAGYYVAIFNGPPESHEALGHLAVELAIEENITILEKLLATAASKGAHALIKYGSLLVSVVISVFTSSPILKESRYRGYLPDGTPILYVILDPQD